MYMAPQRCDVIAYVPFVPVHSAECCDGVESVAEEVEREDLAVLDDAVLDQAHAQLLRVLGDQLRLLGERSAVRVCRERHQVLAQHLKKTQNLQS